MGFTQLKGQNSLNLSYVYNIPDCLGYTLNEYGMYINVESISMVSFIRDSNMKIIHYYCAYIIAKMPRSVGDRWPKEAFKNYIDGFYQLKISNKHESSEVLIFCSKFMSLQ